MEITRVFLNSRYDLSKIVKQITINSKLKWIITKDPQDCDYFISFDSINIGVKRKNIKYILIRNEPKIILPECYKKKNLKRFDKIIDIGKPDNIATFSINSVQNLEIFINNQSRFSNKAVMINSNLFSLRSGELYSLRRKVLYKTDIIDLYGFGWDKNLSSKFKVLLVELRNLLTYTSAIKLKGQFDYFKKYNSNGPVKDKYKILTNYRFALIIENSMTYVSEKIFDALVTGCIPIYVGIDLEQFMLPDFLYIKAEPNIESIKDAFKFAQTINYEEWQAKCKNWLESKEVNETWSIKFFLLDLKKAIENQVN
jgi:hypothetical protein